MLKEINRKIKKQNKSIINFKIENTLTLQSKIRFKNKHIELHKRITTGCLKKTCITYTSIYQKNTYLTYLTINKYRLTNFGAMCYQVHISTSSSTNTHHSLKHFIGNITFLYFLF